MTREEAVIELAAAGRLYVTPSRPLAKALDEAEFFSLWAIAGQITGHEWCSCSLCHEVQLIMPSSKRRCHMTPACHGAMVRIVPRPRMTKALRVALGLSEESRWHTVAMTTTEPSPQPAQPTSPTQPDPNQPPQPDQPDQPDKPGRPLA